MLRLQQLDGRPLGGGGSINQPRPWAAARACPSPMRRLTEGGEGLSLPRLGVGAVEGPDRTTDRLAELYKYQVGRGHVAHLQVWGWQASRCLCLCVPLHLGSYVHRKLYPCVEAAA